MNVPVKATEGQNGLDFANVLRDCLASAVITVDDRRKITGLNQKAGDLVNLKASHVVGKSADLLPPAIQEAINDTFSSGKPVIDRELVIRNGTRAELPVQASTTPIQGAAGKITGIVVVLNDISSARKWEANMRRLDRLHNVGTLSASMAHEVKNAFVAIKTFVDLLLEQNKQAELADIVRLEMGRIDSILGQMRKFSRPPKPEYSLVRLHLILEKSLQLIQHLLEDRKIKVSRSLAARPNTVNGDPDQLEQAFINLFFNALEAMEPGGKLTVSTDVLPAGSKVPGVPEAKSQSFIRVLIQDTGAGIALENMNRLFEPFFTTKPEGTGLGLAITRRIIHEHQGTISAESVAGKGTTFTLFLPTSA